MSIVVGLRHVFKLVIAVSTMEIFENCALTRVSVDASPPGVLRRELSRLPALAREIQSPTGCTNSGHIFPK